MSPQPNPAKPLAEQDTSVLLAMLIFGEARGQSYQAKVAVGCVVKNRAALHSTEFGKTLAAVMTRPWAFDCFNHSDPNHAKVWAPVAVEGEYVWDECYHAAVVALSTALDYSGGALFYFSPPIHTAPHIWGPVEVSRKIDSLTFCRRLRLS